MKHTAYTLKYDEQYEQADWVAYSLTASQALLHQKRSNKFVEDPFVPTGSAMNADYSKSGFDRGHLAPAADMGRSATTMKESFYYSNMSPQLPSFNRGIWKHLEALVHNWAIDYDSIIVVTGPVLGKGLETIGPDKVAVPRYYYKVILDAHSRPMKGIAFLLPNASSSSESLQSYVVTIDYVEKMTGIDFFPALPDKEEDELESERCLNCWSWNVPTTAKRHRKRK